MTPILEIDVSTEFSPYPGGRMREDGKWTGQAFREDILLPALKKADRIVLIMNGALGYPTSFLEEAFGGLVRECHISGNELLQRFEFRYRNEYTVEVIKSMIRDAASVAKQPCNA